MVDVISESMIAFLHLLATREHQLWEKLPRAITVRALLRRDLIRRAGPQGEETDLVLTAAGRALHKARCVRCRDTVARPTSYPSSNDNEEGG